MPLKDIVGQSWAVETLLRNLRNRKVAPVYLFHGPEGAGKESAALSFAQALVCSNPQPDGDACGTCKDCRKVLPTESEPFGKHPDVYHLAVGIGESASKERITVRQVRELQQWLAYAPLESMRKVVIVHQAETLAFGRGEAGNALLKTLEEPPIWAVFVLLAPSPTAVQETIRSRSRTVAFGPIKPSIIEDLLRDDLQLPRAEARLAARLSGGSIEVARALVEDEGIKRRHELLSAWLEAAENPVSGLERLERAVGKSSESARDAARTLIDVLFTFYRDVLLIATTNQTDNLINADFQDQIQRIAKRARPRNLGRFVDALLRKRFELQVNVAPSGVVETLFITAQELGVI